MKLSASEALRKAVEAQNADRAQGVMRYCAAIVKTLATLYLILLKPSLEKKKWYFFWAEFTYSIFRTKNNTSIAINSSLCQKEQKISENRRALTSAPIEIATLLR